MSANNLSAKIGLRFLTAKSANGFISFISLSAMLGISVGITVLLVIMSAMNGFERELKDKLLGVVPHGEISMINKPIANWQGLAEQATKMPGVISAAPLITTSGLILQGNDLSALKLDGVIPSVEQSFLNNANYVSNASWQGLESQRGSIILGQGIIDDLELTIGEQINILIPQPSSNGRFKAPSSVSFTLIGAFRFGGQLDYSQAYIHLDDARELNAMTHGVSHIRFKFDDAFNAPIIIRNLANQIQQYVYLSDWTRQHGHLYSDIQLVKVITYIVLVLVIAVASFNIVSTLVMSVKDKESEIAILLTMGLTQGKVKSIFIVQGMINSTLGCLLGGIVGIILAKNLSSLVQWIEQSLNFKVLASDIYFIDTLPSAFHWSDLLLLVGSTLVISLIATLYPAIQASKIQPAVVLGQ
ncbi:lipoprotein-releasing ABC transporter permease subunit LolE [Psychrobium sp. 1_MG-2023]|uniref:lipoprotein-releasing ABC transporter permease subunit LolE n=1 Tax=Psychrobium sp. 1_MG-2023 TaxID=3062624 RepID=UPI000C31BD09|nr:lipoprotein-releasing ABC transporter permease subunit LolE [Psychrobium sp. 1_MG-2023]MDP2560285.1 lipoprotein-releasing ABC transporter permease subunit LolE [Psychrobium sp. 1_MG-2023]PKF55402.1 lipoprotein-releasing system transmembrane subunit LolE [Alteromonadales bacterium alter-6D02]